MKLTSPVFSDHQSIPAVYTCEGKNISPPLKWSEIPTNAQSLALTIEDPDAPAGNWTHWILYNLPTSLSGLSENLSTLPAPARVGLNSWKTKQYGGPCPPTGEHRYIFSLYALDTLLKEQPLMSLDTLKSVMQGHILDSAELIGTYQKQN